MVRPWKNRSQCARFFVALALPKDGLGPVFGAEFRLVGEK